MKYLITSLILAFAASLLMADEATKINTIDDYNGWGWQSIVMQNDMITVATMPDIGARIMQYDLDGHPSIFVNPAEVGKVHAPKQGTWYNYGGYKVWPAPQDRWSWTPPAQLDSGPFTSQIIDDTADSVSVFVRSPKAVWTKHADLPGLVIERRTVIYKGTSRVKVEQSFVNTTSSEMTWSIWDVTQSIVHHQGEKDYSNFWVYFPIKKEGSVFGSKGVKTSKSSTAWKGEVAPGVYGVQFKPEGKKIFADSPEGWIAYVDERDGYAFIKTFDIREGQDYPDDGAHNEVWINSEPTAYLEVEVVSPIWPIAANDGKITFVENWYAAHVYGPIIAANNVGAVAGHLRRKTGTTELSGIYGIFYSGTAQIVYLNQSGEVIKRGAVHTVSPKEEFDLKESLAPPADAATVEVRVFDAAGALVGAVDSMPVQELTGVNSETITPVDFNLQQNYPNPFNPTTTISFALDRSQFVSLDIFDSRGRRIDSLVDEFLSRGRHRITWNASSAAGGVYFARLQAGAQNRTIKMILLK